MSQVHAKVTAARISRLIRANMTAETDSGVCVKCNKTVRGVEPDAERYSCPKCKTPTVYGAEQVLVLGLFSGAKIPGLGSNPSPEDKIEPEVTRDAHAEPEVPVHDDLHAYLDAMLAAFDAL